MPRNTRNSWVDINVAGRKNDIETGPRAEDGTMTARFYVRHEGRVQKSVTVSTWADPDGTLDLCVYRPEGACVLRHTTHRDDGQEKIINYPDDIGELLAIAHSRILEKLYDTRETVQETGDTQEEIERAIEQAEQLASIERQLNDVRCDWEKV